MLCISSRESSFSCPHPPPACSPSLLTVLSLPQWEDVHEQPQRGSLHWGHLLVDSGWRDQ